jgi:uncharacterized oxidoreductase
VIIAARGQKAVDETATANPGMKALVFDISSPASIDSFAAQLREEFPSLNILINNAGIMRTENLSEKGVSAAEETITTNLLGPIRLTNAVLPLLQKQPRAAIVNVSSGLAFVPLAMTPTYCATKGALHSYTQSLRYQLRDTKVDVIELIPPYVQTTLMGEQQASDPNAMPLDEYIAEVMEIFQTRPQATEICVKKVQPLRFAAESGRENYEVFFEKFNDSMHK